MIIITKFPTRNLNDNPALLSKWSCVHHPILFEACRQDVKIQYVINNAGVMSILLYSLPPADLQVGQKIQLVTTNGAYATDAEVTVTSINGLVVTITDPGTIPGISIGGYFNMTTARLNHIIETDVLAVSDSNQYYSVGVLETKAAPNGTFKINPSAFLRDIAELRGDSFLYDQLNKKIVGAGSRFNFRMREVWAADKTDWTTPSNTNVFYWTNGTKQLQEKYGFNVAEHVLFPAVDTTKFLTSFERPTYFPGFPFSLSFIWSDKMSGHSISKIEEGFDINGASGGTSSFSLDASQSFAVNRLTLSDALEASTRPYYEVWLTDDGATASVGWVKPGWVLAGYYQSQTGVPVIRDK